LYFFNVNSPKSYWHVFGFIFKQYFVPFSNSPPISINNFGINYKKKSPPVSDKILFNILAGNSIGNVGLFPTTTTVSEASLGIEISLII